MTLKYIYIYKCITSLIDNLNAFIRRGVANIIEKEKLYFNVNCFGIIIEDLLYSQNRC